MIWILFLIICVLFVGREYLKIRKKLKFWKDNGIPYISPIWTIFRHPVHPLNQRMYEEFKGKAPFGAFFRSTTPTLFVTDLDLVKDILVKNFDHFVNRIDYGKISYGFAFGGVFFAKGQEWKMQRRKTSPFHTSKNLKKFHKSLSDVTENFLKNMERTVPNDKEIDGNALMKEYVIETGGTIFFGSTFQSVKDKEYFRKLIRNLNNNIIPGTISFVRYAVWLPKLSEFLKMNVATDKIREIFLNYLHKTLEIRMKNNEDVDLVGLCLKIENEEKSENQTFRDIANQLYFFYFTQFNIVRRILTFLVYELALNQEIQNQAREEIKKYIAKYNGKCSYDACMEMKYVNQIILGLFSWISLN